MKILLTMMVIMGILSACATPSQVLVNLDTGQVVRCAYTATTVYESQDQCVQDARRMGFIEIEKAATTGISLTSNNAFDQPIVATVRPGSPAYKAGVKVGDKIIGRDGRRVKSIGEINSMPRLTVGGDVEYKVLRNGQELLFKMKAIAISDALRIR